MFIVNTAAVLLQGSPSPSLALLFSWVLATWILAKHPLRPARYLQSQTNSQSPSPGIKLRWCSLVAQHRQRQHEDDCHRDQYVNHNHIHAQLVCQDLQRPCSLLG